MEKIIDGYYGTHNPCKILVYNRWYCVMGSQMVNMTFEPLTDGINVETIEDINCFTWHKPINYIHELIQAVED